MSSPSSPRQAIPPGLTVGVIITAIAVILAIAVNELSEAQPKPTPVPSISASIWPTSIGTPRP